MIDMVTEENMFEEEITPEEIAEFEDTEEVDKILRESVWKEEAEQIPIEALEEKDKLILLKFRQHEQLTPEEDERLAEILQQYRPAIQKVQPKELIKNYKQNTLLVDDEKTFLNMVDEFDQVQVIPFTFYIGTQQIRMKFDLYPLTDSQAISDITENLSMFQDFTEDELITYNKMQNNETLTREEILIRARVQEKINKLAVENTKQTVVEYLALQLKFHGKDTSNEAMKTVLSQVPNAYLNVLFDEVQRRNHLGDVNTESVFQTFD